MISLKVLSTRRRYRIGIAMVAPSVSFAQAPPGLKAHGAPGVGGGGARGGFAGGGVKAGGAGPRFNGGGPRYGGGGGYYHGGGGYYRGGGGGGGFIPGAVAGALIGGAIASQGYYGGPGYYAPAPGYYDEGGPVAVDPGPAGGDDAVAYCMQTYRSYDPRSGTYLGNDGYRHPARNAIVS